MPSALPPPAPGVAALARSVREDCALLAQSLAALAGLTPEQAEEALAGHLAETRVLQQRIAASVQHLAARRREVERLPASQRDEAEACIAEAKGRLQAAADVYGALAADVADVLAAIRQRLDGIRQGGRMLRSYRQAAR